MRAGEDLEMEGPEDGWDKARVGLESAARARAHLDLPGWLLGLREVPDDALWGELCRRYPNLVASYQPTQIPIPPKLLCTERHWVEGRECPVVTVRKGDLTTVLGLLVQAQTDVQNPTAYQHPWRSQIWEIPHGGKAYARVYEVREEGG